MRHKRPHFKEVAWLLYFAEQILPAGCIFTTFNVMVVVND